MSTLVQILPVIYAVATCLAAVFVAIEKFWAGAPP